MRHQQELLGSDFAPLRFVNLRCKSLLDQYLEFAWMQFQCNVSLQGTQLAIHHAIRL